MLLYTALAYELIRMLGARPLSPSYVDPSGKVLSPSDVVSLWR